MKLKFIISGVVLFITTQSILAQNSLSGTISDKDTKSLLSYVTVSISDLHTFSLTDTLGNYNFTKLPAASYQIQISAVRHMEGRLKWKAWKEKELNSSLIYQFKLIRRFKYLIVKWKHSFMELCNWVVL